MQLVWKTLWILTNQSGHEGLQASSWPDAMVPTSDPSTPIEHCLMVAGTGGQGLMSGDIFLEKFPAGGREGSF